MIVDRDGIGVENEGDNSDWTVLLRNDNELEFVSDVIIQISSYGWYGHDGWEDSSCGRDGG